MRIFYFTVLPSKLADSVPVISISDYKASKLRKSYKLLDAFFSGLFSGGKDYINLTILLLYGILELTWY